MKRGNERGSISQHSICTCTRALKYIIIDQPLRNLRIFVIVLVGSIGWIWVAIGTSLAGASRAVCTLWDMLLTTPPPSGASGYGEGIPGAATNCVRVCLLHPHESRLVQE